jgi:hypothetical protein
MSDDRPRLRDLVANGTMSAEIAATLAAGARERRSILVIAIPRMAGKTTTLRAALDYAPDTAVHALARSLPRLGIPSRPDGGYLFMAEIADVGFDEYLWGDEVRAVFAALGRGFSLATALHAPGVDEAFEVICGENAVPDEDAGRIDLAVYIEIEGRWQAPRARRVAEVREIDRVETAVPLGGRSSAAPARGSRRWSRRRSSVRRSPAAPPPCCARCWPPARQTSRGRCSRPPPAPRGRPLRPQSGGLCPRAGGSARAG